MDLKKAKSAIEVMGTNTLYLTASHAMPTAWHAQPNRPTANASLPLYLVRQNRQKYHGDVGVQSAHHLHR